MPDTMGKFEGSTVVGAQAAIRNAGDGLSKAMKLDAMKLKKGDRVVVVIQCDVMDIQHPAVDKEEPGGPCYRKHILRAGTVVVADDETADELKALLDVQRERVQIADEEAKGILRIDYDLTKAHDAGEHADGVVKGCLRCEEEAGLDEAGL